MTDPEIDLIYFDGCPNVDQTREHLRAALGTGTGGWREWDLSVADTPDRFRRFGSPTILVAGRDVTGRGEHLEGDSLACNADGAPRVEVIREALARGP